MRVTTLIFLFLSLPSLGAATSLTRSREPRFQCEHLLTRKVAPTEFTSARKLLASIFEYSERHKALDLMPGLRPPALEAFNLKYNTPLKDIRLGTRWLYGALTPEADLYLPAKKGELKGTPLMRFTLDDDRVYHWGGAFATDAGELGFLMTSFHLRAYLSVRQINANDSIFVLGLDVDCEEIREFTARPETSFMVLTDDGILCRVPVLMGETHRSERNRLTL